MEHLAVTMGRLIGFLRPHLAGDKVLLDDLGQVLLTRNQLAHRFFREHELDFVTFTGREQMLAELMQATEEFEQMDERFRPVISRFLGALELSDQQLRREVDNAVARLEGLARKRDLE